MAILATKSGWLIGVEIIKETPKAHIVKHWHEKSERRIPKNSTNQKIFDNTDKAQEWINT